MKPHFRAPLFFVLALLCSSASAYASAAVRHPLHLTTAHDTVVENVLYAFQGTADGAAPYASLTFDAAGNLYGTTTLGGTYGYGTVFELVPVKGGWNEKTLYGFQGGHDGASPYGPVIVDASGHLYGTTFIGGGKSGYGTVYELTPGSSGNWTERVIYRFSGNQDGASPLGGLTVGPNGHFFGVTSYGGGSCGCGTVFELARTRRGWRETVLYRFRGRSDAASPGYESVVFDAAGNLYGTTSNGGFIKKTSSAYGTVFELLPQGSDWKEAILHRFKSGNDGALPVSGLVFDTAGNLYGTTASGGPAGDGTVFELARSGTSWRYKVLYAFNGDGNVPFGTLAVHGGNLYGTTYIGGNIYNGGTVFELKPQRNGKWLASIIYVFAANNNNITGYAPVAGVVFDSSGTLYGTTVKGGGAACHYLGCGVVYSLTGASR